MRYDMKSFIELAQIHRDGTLLICGGGPSLADDLDTIRDLRSQGAMVLSVNKTHDFLLSHGIKPDYHVLLDPMEWVADYVKEPIPGVKYLLASQCHRNVFKRLKAGDCYLWHAYADFYGQNYPAPLLEKEFRDKQWICIPGSTTVGMRSIYLGQAMSCRIYHLFGMDSSMVYDAETKTGTLHAYAKKKPDDAKEGWAKLKTAAGIVEFYTNEHMARQVDDFDDALTQMAAMVRLKEIKAPYFTVHGTGLLPTYAATLGWHANQNMNNLYEFKTARTA